MSDYIIDSLLTLGTVIGTLAENAARNKTYILSFIQMHLNSINLIYFSDHVPFRNSKLTRMLQPSLSGNARISVICTINPDGGAVAESMSTLLFAQRIKRVQVRFHLYIFLRSLN
jgi:centromeric protein E